MSAAADSYSRVLKQDPGAIMTGIRAGFIANLPVGASVAAYGAVLGVLAAQKGLTWFQVLMMNLFVFAGSAQFVMVDMWVDIKIYPLPVAEIVLAVMIINLRYLLIGASLAPQFSGRSLAHKCLFMHLVADENWAVTMAEARKGGGGVYFLFGGGLCVLFTWCAGTLSGHGFGTALANPEALALDFVFIAVFTALCAGMWQGKRDIFPWIIAAGLAIIASRFLPGKWYIIIGGVGGALTAALLTDIPKESISKSDSSPESGIEIQDKTESDIKSEATPDMQSANSPLKSDVKTDGGGPA